jgi:uncharacterized protein YkwD
LLRSRMLLAAMLAGAVFLLSALPAHASQRRSMVRAIGAARGAQLNFSERLSRAAAAWARHLFGVGRLAHSARAVRAGQGEIIEWHTGDAANVGGVVGEWMGSASHHEVIMNGIWRRAGAARATGSMNGERSTIWVVRFAR